MDLNRQDEDGRSPFYLACMGNMVGVVREMLNDPRVQVNLPSNNGWSPLMVACFLGLKDIVRLLLEHVRTDLCVASKSGMHVLEFLVENNLAELLELLFALRGRAFGVHPKTWAIAYPGSSLTLCLGCSELASTFRASPEQTRQSLRQKLFPGTEWDELWMDLAFASIDLTHQSERVRWVMSCGIPFRRDNLSDAVRAMVESAEVDLLKRQLESLRMELQTRDVTYQLSQARLSKEHSDLVQENATMKFLLTELKHPTPTAMLFPMQELEAATENFAAKYVIGEGGCAQVFKARLGHVLVAIKRINATPQSIETMQKEIRSLSLYRHPWLIPLIGHTALDGGQPCLIYPLMPQGSLRDRLDCREESAPIAWDMRVRILYQAAAAIAFLHRPHTTSSESLLHLDVKTDNILLDSEYEVRVGDFGLMRVIKRGEKVETTELSGTPGYMAPEFLEKGTLSDKTDVFAFGVVIFEAFSGKPAVVTQTGGPAQNLAKLFITSMKTPASLVNQALLDHHLNNAWPRDSYQTLVQLGRACVEKDPGKRPEMEEVAARLKLLVEQKHRICAVCMDNPVNARLQCGHAILCSPCAEYLRRRGEGCPICRAPIISIQNGLFSKTFIP